jgi:cleavage and polyadenylation specificity factor subunit 3
MGRLRSALQAKYKERDEEVKVYMPRNMETLEITFRGERVAKVWLIALDRSDQD